MLQILFDKISGMVSNILMLFDGLLEDTPVLMSIAIGLVLAMLSLSIFYFVQEQFFKITRLNTKGITLVDGVRDATRPLRIASNPNDINYSGLIFNPIEILQKDCVDKIEKYMLF